MQTNLATIEWMEKYLDFHNLPEISKQSIERHQVNEA